MSCKKTIKLILFFIFIVIGKIIFAQNNVKNNFIISLQPTYYQIKENNINGLVHANIGYKLDLYFEKYKNRLLNTISISGSYMRPKTKYENSISSVFAGIKLQYDLLYQINQLGKQNIFVGGLIKADYKLAFFPSWDDSHLYWANFFGFGLKSKFEKNINDNKTFICSVEIPILGLVSRPETYRYYKIEEVSFKNLISKNHSQLKLSTFNNYFEANAALGINYKITNKFAVGFQYNIEFARIKTNYSQPFFVLQQGLGLKLIF